MTKPVPDRRCRRPDTAAFLPLARRRSRRRCPTARALVSAETARLSPLLGADGAGFPASVLAGTTGQGLLAVIDELAWPGAAGALRDLYALTPPRLRREPDVAQAFFYAFADAHDPETAEAVMYEALAVVADRDAREAMACTSVCAYARAERWHDVERLALWVDEICVGSPALPWEAHA